MRELALALRALALFAAPAAAAPADELEALMEDVPGATSRYDARDSLGQGLDGLKVIEAGGRYVGVHHSPSGGGFRVSVATSDDLLEWTHRAVLDTAAAQPTIAALPGGGYVVAYEKAFPRVLTFSTELDRTFALLGPVQRLGRPTVRLRFRHYRSLAALLAGRHSRSFTAPLTLSPTAEGTPSIRSARRGGQRVEVGMHYFADLDGDSYPDVDRQARGVLSGFLLWKVARARELNAAFLRLDGDELHAGYTDPPRAHLGDRDHVTFRGQALAVHEAQYLPGDFASWRPFLLEPTGSSLRPIEIRTAGGSTSLGNPTATVLTAPSGAPAVFFSAYVFSEGAAPGETGQLIWYREGSAPGEG